MLRQQNNLQKNNISSVPKIQENQQAKLQSQHNNPQTNVTNQQKVSVNFTNEHSEQQINDGTSHNTSQSISFQPKISEHGYSSQYTNNISKCHCIKERRLDGSSMNYFL